MAHRLRAAVAALRAGAPGLTGAARGAASVRDDRGGDSEGAAGPPDAGAVQAQQFALLRSRVHGMAAYTVTSLGANLLGMAIVEATFWRSAPLALRLGWGVPFLALWLVRAAGAFDFASHRPTSADGYRRWLLRWRAGILLSAALWGAAAWLFYPHGDGLQQLVLVLLVYTYCIACVPVLAPQYGMFAAYTLLVFVPTIARFVASEGERAFGIVVVLALIWATTMTLGRNYRQASDNILRLKRRAEALSEQLRAEKAVADAARHEAEVANRAKTQFFAAASHDLRQPLHALGLFAEALRQRSHDGPAIELVNSINGSVDALEELFSELLDITRIDSGGVDVQPRHFAIAGVLRKLRLHFEPTAFEKGLALRFRGERAHVHADPLLVERILRNLVSNAIRYSDDGGVLVSARRRGDRVLLQVWDTGPGIREAEQQRVFEEFYQVAGPRLAPDQKKGLGLGLAIVKRLAGLMDAPLALRSQPGRGTVFTLDLPAGRAAAAADAAVPARAPAGLTLDGRLIAVVEDEPAVLKGLDVMLTGWGARVAAHRGIDEALAWARGLPPGTAPDLLIVDWRLDDGRTGIDALAALRGVFGRGVPAIMVTGSAMSAHDAEAERHDFHLMLKPVVPNKLRAMIGFKLGGRQGGGAGDPVPAGTAQRQES